MDKKIAKILAIVSAVVILLTTIFGPAYMQDGFFKSDIVSLIILISPILFGMVIFCFYSKSNLKLWIKIVLTLISAIILDFIWLIILLVLSGFRMM